MIKKLILIISLFSGAAFAANPTVGDVAFERDSAQPLRISVDDLLANSTDPQSSALSLQSVSSPSAQGQPVSFSGRWVYYIPAKDFNQTDTFSFVVENALGDSASGVATVTVHSADTDDPTVNIIGLSGAGDDMLVTFAGIPNRGCIVQFSETLAPTAWTNCGTATFGSLGRFVFTHTNVPAGGFYRTVYDLNDNAPIITSTGFAANEGILEHFNIETL